MNTAELLPMLLLALKALGVTGAIGLVGTLLESIGERFGYPKLVRFGQGVEGIAADIPKILRGSRKTAADKADDLPPTPRTGAGAAPIVALLFAGSLALSGALPACSSAATPEARGAQAASVAKLAYGGARVTLRELYDLHLAVQKTVQTEEQAKALGPKLRIALDGLDRAKALLAKAKPLLASGKDEAEVRRLLRGYIAELDALLPVLDGLGVGPSEEARDALGLIRGFLGGAS